MALFVRFHISDVPQVWTHALVVFVLWHGKLCAM